MHVTPLRWNGHTLSLLDQRLLPREEVWLEYHTASEVADAIRDMVVRGAPAIGVSAAFGMAMAARQGADLHAAAKTLKQARPTAVNLAWAVDRMLRASGDLTLEAERILAEDVAANRKMGEYGAQLLGARSTVLTHCNAGALATGGYGTALGVIRAAVEGGKHVAVFADETRPYLQGARLTAWELQRDGIDVTLITDSMSGHFFQQGTFDAVIVGADRIAANGDAANKIEERSAQEVTDILGSRMAPEGIHVRHPAFDVTPARLITAIITERGVLRAPYGDAIRELFA
jgi:methylthioribose-1-phosphate isomerase